MDKNQDIPRIRKGDAFVQMEPHLLVFMEVNEVDEAFGNKDIYIVTWYSLDENSLNVQRRFPMIALDGVFCNFKPISRKLLKEVKSLMRQFDVEAKQLTDKKEAKSLLREYTRKLIELLPDAEERLAIAVQEAKKIVTYKWLDCTDDNYWVEEDPDLNDMYVTLVCYSSESHDDENNENITVQFLYLHDDCPYGWDTLAKCGAKYMVIEKPNK